ncbi:MAG: hypothetical protein ACK2UO_03325 [Caldilineaceae bacterium]
MLYLDAVGVAFFTVQAIDKVLGLVFAPLIAIIMGIIFGLRVAAIYWNLTMPGWLTTKATQ